MVRGIAWCRCAWGAFRLNARLTRRNWQIHCFVGIAVPLGILVGSSRYVDARSHTRILMGALILAALQIVVRRSASTFVEDRFFGHRDLLATTGLTRESYLAGAALDAATLAILPLLAAVIAPLLHAAPWPPSGTWILPYLIASGAFFAASVALASLPLETYGISVLSNLVILIMLGFCPLLYSPTRVPRFLSPLVDLLPPSLAVDLMTASWSGLSLSRFRMIALLVWVAGLAFVGYWYFPWTDDVDTGRTASTI